MHATLARLSMNALWRQKLCSLKEIGGGKSTQLLLSVRALCLSLAFQRSHFGKSLDWINRFLPFALIVLPPPAPASASCRSKDHQPQPEPTPSDFCVAGHCQSKVVNGPHSSLLSPSPAQVLQFDLWLTWVEKLCHSWGMWRLEVGIA